MEHRKQAARKQIGLTEEAHDALTSLANHLTGTLNRRTTLSEALLAVSDVATRHQSELLAAAKTRTGRTS